MVWQQSFSRSFLWIHLPIHCSCSAADAGIESRLCIGKATGFILLYKRLESGSFQWPRSESEARMLTPQQYRWLMEGLSIDQPRAHKPVKGLKII